MNIARCETGKTFPILAGAWFGYAVPALLPWLPAYGAQSGPHECYDCCLICQVLVEIGDPLNASPSYAGCRTSPPVLYTEVQEPWTFDVPYHRLGFCQ